MHIYAEVFAIYMRTYIKANIRAKKTYIKAKIFLGGSIQFALMFKMSQKSFQLLKQHLTIGNQRTYNRL